MTVVQLLISLGTRRWYLFPLMSMQMDIKLSPSYYTAQSFLSSHLAKDQCKVIQLKAFDWIIRNMKKVEQMCSSRHELKKRFLYGSISDWIDHFTLESWREEASGIAISTNNWSYFITWQEISCWFLIMSIVLTLQLNFFVASFFVLWTVWYKLNQ